MVIVGAAPLDSIRTYTHSHIKYSYETADGGAVEGPGFESQLWPFLGGDCISPKWAFSHSKKTHTLDLEFYLISHNPTFLLNVPSKF